MSLQLSEMNLYQSKDHVKMLFSWDNMFKIILEEFFYIDATFQILVQI